MKRRRTRHIGRESGECLCDMLELLDWKPSTVIQVGVGRHFREIDAMVERWGKFALHGFEASSINADAARKTYPGSIDVCAIGAKEGTVDFYDKLRHPNGSTCFPSRNAGADSSNYQKTTIEVKTLDGLFPELSWLDKPILLWVDCEGGELDALKGSLHILPQVEVVNVEVTAVPVCDEWCSMMEVHSWLVLHGFLRQGTHTEDVSAGQCDAIYVRHSLWKPEHCYCPCSFYGVEVKP